MLGSTDEHRAGARLTDLTATVRRNGVDVEIPDDIESNTGPLLDVVATVADTLAEMGEKLSAGELIIAGSIVPPFLLDDATTVEYSLDQAQAISIKVA